MMKILHFLIKKSEVGFLSWSSIGICLVFALPMYSVAQSSVPSTGHLRQIWYNKKNPASEAQRYEAVRALLYIYSTTNLDSVRNLSQEIIEDGKKNNNRLWISNGSLWLGRYHYTKGEAPKALRAYRNALQASTSRRDTISERVYASIGLVYINLYELDSASYYFKKAISLYQPGVNTNKIASDYGNLGTIYHMQGKYLDALDNYLQAKKMGGSSNKSKIMINIGGIFEILGLTKEAKASYQEAVHYSKQDNQPSNVLESYAALLPLCSTLAEGEKNIQKGLQLVDAYEIPRDAMLFLGVTGNFYLQFEELDKATYFYERALTVANSVNDSDYIINTKLNLAEIQCKRGNYQKSLQICMETKAPLEGINHTSALSSLYNIMTLNYEALHQPAQALFYQHQKEAQEMLLNEDENIKATLSTYIQRKSERERAALKLAKTNAEKLAVAVQTKAQLNYGIFGLLSLLLAGAVGVYYTFYRQKKSVTEQLTQVNQLLEGEKQKLTLSNTKLQRFSGIVSHDILSNLDLILSTGNVLVGSRPNPENLNKYYTLTQNTGRQLKAYCLGLLADAKASQGPVLAEIGDPNTVLNKVLERFGPALQEKGFAVEVGELPSSRLPLSVVEQVLQNLVSNALRYASQVPNPRLQIGSGIDARGSLCWFVADNGLGQAAEINRIIQGEQTNSAKGQGIGLNLLQATLRDYGWSLQAEAVDEGGVRLVVGSQG